MEDNKLFPEHWVLRRQPRLLFFYAAIITTAMFALGVITNVMLVYWGTIPASSPLRIFGAFAGVVGAAAALWLWVGMCWYWVQFDRSPRRSKIFWFLMLLIGNWVGATAYYFFVYRGADRHRIQAELP